MSKIKNMSRAGWIVTGVVAALVLVPTVAVATSSVVTIKGSPSGVKANVTPGGELLATGTAAGNLWDTSIAIDAPAGSETVGNMALPTPPSGDFDVVTGVQVNTYVDSSPGLGTFVQFSQSACSEGAYCEFVNVNPSTVGDTVIPLAPGVPQGDDTVGLIFQGIEAELMVNGYFAPCADDSYLTGVGTCA
jgi:hypothetical protein